MGFNQSEEWELHPLEIGATGQAFMGVKSNEKVFFKRNTSPFIAALSAEGIVPKLMWTQRTYLGDTLTAQEWKDGVLLTKDNMSDSETLHLIQKIHQSKHLLLMLQKVGGPTYRPLDFIDEYLNDLSPSLQTHQFFNQIITYLEDSVTDSFYQVEYVTCHGDLNHHNFLKDNDGHLYLVDWECVKIADPVSDLTWLLCQYFKPSQWQAWLNDYRLEMTTDCYKRIEWYSIMNCLLLIKQYFNENRNYKMNETILLLKSIYGTIKKD